MVKLKEDSPEKPEHAPEPKPSLKPTTIIVPVQQEKPEFTDQVVLL